MPESRGCRHTPVCNAFLYKLPLVLDYNKVTGREAEPVDTSTQRRTGEQLVSIGMQLLQYIPSPQRFASDHQPITYTLHVLPTHDRHVWLWSLLLVLYKVD